MTFSNIESGISRIINIIYGKSLHLFVSHYIKNILPYHIHQNGLCSARSINKAVFHIHPGYIFSFMLMVLLLSEQIYSHDYMLSYTEQKRS